MIGVVEAAPVFTARMAAAMMASHLLVDDPPPILADPYALAFPAFRGSPGRHRLARQTQTLPPGEQLGQPGRVVAGDHRHIKGLDRVGQNADRLRQPSLLHHHRQDHASKDTKGVSHPFGGDAHQA